MIRISEARLAYHVPGLTTPGTVVIREKDAQMWASDTQLFVRRKAKPVREFLLAVANVEYMLTAEPIQGVFFQDESPVEIIKERTDYQKTVDAAIALPADDKIRLVKIKGKIVERVGPPQDDELEVLTKPKKTVAQLIAEADSE